MSEQKISNTWEQLQDADCPVCRTRNPNLKEPFAKRVDGLHVVRCVSCAALFVTPRPSDADLERYYAGDIASHMGSGYVARLENTIAGGHYKSFDRVPAPPYKNAALLDVGCAAGYGMLCARSRGWSVTGVETSEPLTSIARNRYGLEVICGTPAEILRTLREPSRRFECISMFDLIEHVSDIPGFLSFYLEFLTTDGLLHLDTPNYPAWVLPGSREADLLYRNFTDILEHLSYLSIDSIRTLSTELKLEIVTWGTYEQRWETAPPHPMARRRIRGVLERIPGFSSLYWRAKRAALSGPPSFYPESEAGTSLYATLRRRSN
jgi:SAM-dependent methyltransferase